jgi:hypothetical protein
MIARKVKARLFVGEEHHPQEFCSPLAWKKSNVLRPKTFGEGGRYPHLFFKRPIEQQIMKDIWDEERCQCFRVKVGFLEKFLLIIGTSFKESV